MEYEAYQRFNERTRGKYTLGVIGAGILALAMLLNGCPKTTSLPRENHIKGAVPVYSGDGGLCDPIYVMDKDSDGIADIILTDYKQALYIATGYREDCRLLVDENTKTLDGNLREAATKAMQADQELNALLTTK